MSLKGIAKATLAILDQGFYLAPDGSRQEIQADLSHATRHTRLYTPAALATIAPPDATSTETTIADIEVREGTTQAIARAIVQDEGLDDLVLLCFASARNVCGGFLNGARSQEEDLARSSGLYTCLLTQPDYYTTNRAQTSLLYTDHLIYSPRIPFFRERNRQLLARPFLASVITAPAPNAGQYLSQELGTLAQVREALSRRAGHVLAIARQHHHRSLLLGAWGCGVFCNDPHMVAEVFAEHLHSPAYAHAFDRVVFGVYDRTPKQHTLCAFQERFPVTM